MMQNKMQVNGSMQNKCQHQNARKITIKIKRKLQYICLCHIGLISCKRADKKGLKLFLHSSLVQGRPVEFTLNYNKKK